MTRVLFSSVLLLLISAALHAQSPFKTKKEQKFYEKINKLYENGDYEGILDKEAEIIAYSAGREDTVAAVMNFFLGDSYLLWNDDLETAAEFFRQEYQIRKDIGQVDEGFTNTAFNLGYVLDELGYFSETEKIYLDLLKIDEELFGKASENYIYDAQSLLDHYIFTEEYQKGLALAQDIKKVVKKKTFEEAMLERFIGDFYEMAGESSKAEKHLLKAIDLLNEQGMYASIENVSFLVSLAGLYTNNGKLPLAEEVYLEAKDILKRLPEDWTDYEVRLNGNIALLQQFFGNYELAEEIYLDNLAKSEELYGKESINYAIETLELGNVHFFSGSLEKAHEYYNQSASILEQTMGKENLYYARILQNKAYILAKQEKFDAAIQTAKEAVSLTEDISGDNQYQTSFPYYYLANVYFMMGDLENARESYEKSLALRKKSVGKQHDEYSKATRSLATLNWEMNEFSDAKSYYAETFQNYFTQINTIFPILSEEEKSKFYYTNLRPAFEQYNSFIVETSRDEKELIGEMYNYQLATKGIILSATNKVKNAILNSGDEELISKYENWISQKERLAKLFSATDIPLDIRNAKIDSLTTLSNSLEKELSKLSTAFADNFAAKDMTWQDVRDQLKTGEAAVEIIRFRDFDPAKGGSFTEEVYYAALIVTPDTEDYPEMVIMKNGKMMETRYLSNYRNAIKYKINEDFSYKLFWRPIANKLEGIKKVYFSPDGVFNQISIYTLRNPATGNFTLDELEIQLVNNTKDLLAVNAGSAADRSYLFGYPNYNMGVIEQKQKESGASADKIIKAAAEDRAMRGASRGVRGSRGGDQGDLAELTRSGSLPRGLRGNMLRYMRSNAMLSLLPGTKKEVNLIDSLYAKKNAQAVTYLSNEALEDSIKKVQNPRTLHIATHGFFLENDQDHEGEKDTYVQNPLLRSGLILAGANSFISEGVISNEIPHDEDGILTAFEAMNLNLDNTELVVLSACETGLGEVKNGEGVYGLQRAFQVAGADAIIMSMWTVDDDATQELMTNFYEEWLSGKTKHEAFITAQKRLKDKWQAPYYWGAFVMVGN
ncbi:CHAT domain-containing protein [Marinoscillum furvescens]|uniref:Tetratricopeptide repeat protein n=1 Tax=Marinoscillum furvescens DSM 4134 TaxID=1122208 RepID=A0A3D9KXT2_MARFU|nr:CHAT domain-containing protein [Marinoscillum furvescens]RED94061.1 tetratricopeptide repeat protein [Marinoscillum furvescens DSM 4134]